MLFPETNPHNRFDTPSTMSNFWQLCCEYLRYYQEGAITFWRSMRPASYSAILAGVWLIGFLLLKSGAKR